MSDHSDYQATVKEGRPWEWIWIKFDEHDEWQPAELRDGRYYPALESGWFDAEELWEVGPVVASPTAAADLRAALDRETAAIARAEAADAEVERLRAENERLHAIALGVIALEDEPDAYPSCDTERLIEQARDVLEGRRHPTAERLRALWIRNAEMREALEWYAGKVRDCRKIGPEGDAAMAMLDADAGKRARAALAGGGGDE